MMSNNEIKLISSGQTYETNYDSGKVECLKGIVGTGTGIVTFRSYSLEPEIGYSQSSGHGEIIGYTYAYGKEKSVEFELSMDPKETQSNILKAVYGTDDEIVVLQIQYCVTRVSKK